MVVLFLFIIIIIVLVVVYLTGGFGDTIKINLPEEEEEKEEEEEDILVIGDMKINDIGDHEVDLENPEVRLKEGYKAVLLEKPLISEENRLVKHIKGKSVITVSGKVMCVILIKDETVNVSVAFDNRECSGRALLLTNSFYSNGNVNGDFSKDEISVIDYKPGSCTKVYVTEFTEIEKITGVLKTMGAFYIKSDYRGLAFKEEDYSGQCKLLSSGINITADTGLTNINSIFFFK